MFDILSDQSDVNHPLCEECADFVIDQMDHQLRILEDECRDYHDFLESLEKSKNCQVIEEEEKAIELLKNQVSELKLEEGTLLKELKEIEDDKKEVENKIEKQMEDLKRMNLEENKYWLEYNNLKRTLFECDDEQQSVDNQLRYAQTNLDRLKRTNVFNATFHIW